jgi:hypothetical protein
MDELKQIIFKIFDTQVKDADVYYNNGSTWLIFTNKKKWVFELTKEGTLWYNYYFFKNFFELLSLDVIENQNYITEWVEYIIQNGVKETTPSGYLGSIEMKGKIVYQFESPKQNNEVEDTIQNGVRETGCRVCNAKEHVEDTIQNGVKETTWTALPRHRSVEDTIQNGVKETKMEEHHRLREVVKTVKDGVKETNPHFLEILNPINFEPVIKEMKRMNEVNIVLDKGIKEVKELPDKSGELRGYGDYYYRQEDRTKSHTKYVDDVITNGIKKTKPMDEWVNTDRILDGVIRDGVKETWGYERQPQIRVNEVINGGIKKTNWRKVDNHPTFLDNIIKSNKM